MKLLPLDKLGAREGPPGIINFGIFLPGISPSFPFNDTNLRVKIIHEDDQFIQDIQPTVVRLQHSVDGEYGDYWSGQTQPDVSTAPHPRSAWGEPGKYVYRYCLYKAEHPEIDWIIDPFAREFGVGKLSGITLGYTHHEWDASEYSWKIHNIDDLIMYELNINEFGGDIERTVKLLSYLADLGVNCLEFMPVSNVSNTVDWGYMPIGYFGVDERFGNRRDFQRLVEEAHKLKIAVIVDAVYAHCAGHFAYAYLYEKVGRQSPLLGPFAEDAYGTSTDFGKKFTQDFFYTVNHHWLDCYHVDGFRYDYVPGYWDGPVGVGYANLVYNTYQMVKSSQGAGYSQRFFNNGTVNLIQCAEKLNGPREVLEQSYSNCTWQDETYYSAKNVACGNRDELASLGHKLGLSGFTLAQTTNGDNVKKSALQYIENHDHSRFVCNFGTFSYGNELLQEGDRENRWYKVQPYLIGIFTAKGIPLIWQGQEFGENYLIPENGMGRVMLFRPVRWDYFYDEKGKALISLIRRLIRIRRERSQFRYGDHYFYNSYELYQSVGVLLFSRNHDSNFSLIALNFSNDDRWIPFRFPYNGDYREELHNNDFLSGVNNTEDRWFHVPGNYGKIWTLERRA
jgi:1,4-alpha-glucan branching enzyme